MRRVVIHQPDFLPWLGYFHRVANADLIIDLDHVQFVSGTSRSWMHRDLIKTRTGAKWLSLSVKKATLGTPICDILLSADPDWRYANLRLLRENYRHASFFDDIIPAIEALYMSTNTHLVAMNLESISIIESFLRIDIPRCRSSEMQPIGCSNAMLIDLLKKVDATHYISGLGARAYLDTALFTQSGIEVIWQKFSHPVYKQLHGEFVENLSAIDALFNCGSDGVINMLRNSP